MLARVSATPQTVAAAIKAENQLATLRKHFPAETMAALVLLLNDVNDAFNVARPLNGAQIGALAGILMRQWWYLKLEEIIYVIERGKSGAYGKVYEGLDVPKINAWFEAYDTNERLALCEMNRAEEVRAGQLEQDEVLAAYRKMAEGKELDTHRAQRERAEGTRNDQRETQLARVEAHRQNIDREAWFFGEYPDATVGDYNQYLRRGVLPAEKALQPQTA